MKYFFIILSFVLLTPELFAQDGERFERVQTIMVAHITKSLDLSKEEAEKFWPVFNVFSKKEFELRSTHRKIIRQLNLKIDDLSDKDIAENNLKLDKIREELYQNENDLYKQLKGILSEKKILKLKFARENFQKHLLEQLRQRQKGRN